MLLRHVRKFGSTQAFRNRVVQTWCIITMYIIRLFCMYKNLTVYVYTPSSSMRLYSLAVAVETRTSLWVCKSPVVRKFTCRCGKYPSRSNFDNFKSFLFHSDSGNPNQYYSILCCDMSILFLSCSNQPFYYFSLCFCAIFHVTTWIRPSEVTRHQTRWTDMVFRIIYPAHRRVMI